ncbi:hypothetical protein AAFF_G00393550 [Aldrovandia affinis]|uniref:Uncharacterized protein n=1 Tax=Aldrovandia affinis TaxID=143900 RepID=A0AAD7WKP7_9TELE|nr:hypothetical protein AAFF_G00393550 [Aldrovandia affinis]
MHCNTEHLKPARLPSHECLISLGILSSPPWNLQLLHVSHFESPLYARYARPIYSVVRCLFECWSQVLKRTSFPFTPAQGEWLIKNCQPV